jgi:hypothetical protein
MPRRVDAGATVAAAGGIVLLVSLFLDWYGDDDAGFSGWTLFEVIDLLLAAISLLALSTFVRRAGIETRTPDAPLLLLGAAAVVLTGSQLIDAPPAAFELDPQTGAWLALAGSLLMLAGAFMSVARVSFSVEHRERAAPPPPPAADPETETVKLRPPDQPA